MNRILVALVGLLVFAPTVSAAPVLNPPTPESLRDSRPLFSWTLASDERANTITVSTSAAVTPEGEFFDENRVTGDALTDLTQWQPTSRLSAGAYYWNLQWYKQDFSQQGYTPPSAFTIPLRLEGARVSVTQSKYFDTEVSYSVVSNAKSIVTTCTVLDGVRVVRRKSKRLPFPTPGVRAKGSCMMAVPDALNGKRLRAVVKVVAGVKSVSASRVFTAR